MLIHFSFSIFAVSLVFIPRLYLSHHDFSAAFSQARVSTSCTPSCRSSIEFYNCVWTFTWCVNRLNFHWKKIYLLNWYSCIALRRSWFAGRDLPKSNHPMRMSPAILMKRKQSEHFAEPHLDQFTSHKLEFEPQSRAIFKSFMTFDHSHWIHYS